MFKIIFLILLFEINIIDGITDVKIILDEYTIIGEEYTSSNGVNINSFLGLPFAKPPVGHLRHEKPQKLEKNSSKIINANKMPVGCHMTQDFTRFGSKTSEDCLYMNILTPQTTPPDDGFPVLVFIHGGGYTYGAIQPYGIDKFANTIVKHGIILVTVQYRLAWWGFSSFENEILPGNLALWDNTIALEFINKNIKHFEGNNKKITLWGHSAGAISVGALAISPKSRYLFQQAISHSGSFYGPYNISPFLKEHTLTISKSLGCNQNDFNEIKKCMKNEKITHQNVIKAIEQYPQMNDDIARIRWTPIIDNEFFEGKTVEELTNESPPKNTLHAYTDGESAMFTLKQPNPITGVFATRFGIELDKIDTFSKDDFKAIIDNYFIREYRSGPHLNKIRQMIYDYYFKESVNNDTKHYYKQLVMFMNFATFFAGLSQEVELKLQNQWEQYLFLYDYIRPDEIDTYFGVDMAPHGYELMFLSDVRAYVNPRNDTLIESEKRIQQEIEDTWISFIKTGKPQIKTNNVQWSKIIDPIRLDYMSIGKETKMDNTYFTDQVKFWRHLAENGFILNNLNNTSWYSNPKNNQHEEL